MSGVCFSINDVGTAFCLGVIALGTLQFGVWLLFDRKSS